MKIRDLLTQPCWTAKDLGEPLPNSPHAVSVALPRWKDVIDYEEKKPTCLNALKAVYPRFGFNPLVLEIVQEALILNGTKGFSAWPYPNAAAAEQASRHCYQQGNEHKVFILECLGFYCLIATEESTPHAKAFWQHAGLGISSRQAAIALGKEALPSQQDAKNAKNLLRSRIAKLYGCRSELIQLHPSGMAALRTALEAITTILPKRPTLQIGFPYVDVLKLPEVVFEGSHLFLDTGESDLAEILDDKKPAAVIVELPSNPMLQCVNLQKVAHLAHERGIPIIADDTIGSAINIDALPYADIVFSSLTKSFAGRGDILAGALVVSPHSHWFEELKYKVNQVMPTELSDADAIALEETSRDISTRIPALNKACDSLKNKLQRHNNVARVLHPGDCPNFKSIMRKGGGFGCLLTIELKGGLPQAKKVYDALRVCKGPSLGTNFTLACPYVLLAHFHELAWANKCGVPSHLIRVSVGLEDQEDLWDRFNTALNS